MTDNQIHENEIDASAGFWIVRDAWGKLTLIDQDGTRHSNITAIPLFPVSEPDHWISLVNSKGEEIFLVESLERLPVALKTIIKEELTFRELVPRILNVHSVSGATEPCEWIVDTDRGRTSFVLNAEEDIRRLSAHTVQIIDGKGVRYRVDDTRKIDPRSRRFIEWYV